MKLSSNHPMARLVLADLIGLDVRLAVIQTIHDAFASSKYWRSSLLREMAAEGYLGHKTRLGIHRY